MSLLCLFIRGWREDKAMFTEHMQPKTRWKCFVFLGFSNFADKKVIFVNNGGEKMNCYLNGSLKYT